MPVHALRALLAGAAMLVTLPSWSQAVPGSCQLPAGQADPMRDRESLLAEYERLPQDCLQALVTSCSHAADQSLLDFGSAAVCSFGYEALLKQGFGGDFRALLAWWARQRAEPLR